MTASLNRKNRSFPLIPYIISLVLSDSIGSGHDLGSRLPMATTVIFVTSFFFVLGPSVEMLMGLPLQ